MSPPRRFRVYALLLGLTSLLSLAMVADWQSHSKTATVSMAAITPSAADPRTIPYRVDQLELALQKMADQHDRLMWLLVANLAGGLASLATYLLTNRRRFFQDRAAAGDS